jgi:hypothetical protein
MCGELFLRWRPCIFCGKFGVLWYMFCFQLSLNFSRKERYVQNGGAFSVIFREVSSTMVGFIDRYAKLIDENDRNIMILGCTICLNGYYRSDLVHCSSLGGLDLYGVHTRAQKRGKKLHTWPMFEPFALYITWCEPWEPRFTYIRGISLHFTANVVNRVSSVINGIRLHCTFHCVNRGSHGPYNKIDKFTLDT